MRQGVVQRADAPHNWSFGGHWVGAALGLDRVGMGSMAAVVSPTGLKSSNHRDTLILRDTSSPQNICKFPAQKRTRSVGFGCCMVLMQVD